MNVPSFLRRWAETLVILGLCLLTVTAVSWAEEGPAPTPTPTATPAATSTPEITATATPELSPTPTPSPTPGPTVAPLTDEVPKAVAQATITPTPTATATPEGEGGAALTLCHYTGDATAPYVAVTIDGDEFSEHYDHEQDLIPAPSSGCATEDPGGQTGDPETICHATGNPERPFLLLVFPDGDLGGHENHPGDLIPAPDGVCPGDYYGIPTPTPTAEPTATPEETAEPTATAEATATPDDGDVDADDLGDEGEAAGTTTATTPAGSLPFTGLELWLLFAAGAGFLLTGTGLRLLAD